MSAKNNPLNVNNEWLVIYIEVITLDSFEPDYSILLRVINLK